MNKPAQPLLNRSSSKPLYLQIYEELAELLASGTLKPGDQFPAELDLVQKYGVARITVRRAISDMVREGRLVRHAGKGTFVAAPKIERQLVDVSSFTARMEALGLHPSAHVLEVKVMPATARLARELEITLESPIVSIVRLRYSDDDPVALEHSYLSLERCPGLDQVDLNNVSLYRLLAERYDLHPVRSHKTLELTTANAWEAKHLLIAPGAPLFLLRATVLGNEGPMEHAKILLRGERFRFQI